MAENVTSLFRSTAAHSPSMAALTRESGDGTGPVDFCIPCNPYFPTPEMFQDMAARLREIITYYPSSAETITAELCELLQLPPQCVAMGNGSTELITWIDHLLVRESLAVPVPTFGRWTDQPMETGKRVDMFPLQESNGFVLDLAQYAEFIRKRGTRVAVICNPNNPDGGFQHRQSLVQFMDAMADLDLVVIDESFLEFADAEEEPSVVQEAMLRPNVVVLRSLGKNFGLHGIRFGYLVANPSIAGRIRSMLPKWNLNSFAEHVVFMLKEHSAEYRQSLQQVRRDRAEMAGQLSALPGLTVYPSQGNFLFVRLPLGADGTVVRDRLLTEHRILVRECGNKIGSSSRFLRLVVRPEVDVRRLVSAMEQVLYDNGGNQENQENNAEAGQEGAQQAAGTEQGARAGYSSGTAAVDRLVNETNGSGVRMPAAQSAAPAAAGGGTPLAATASAAPAPQPAGGGVPMPAPAQPVPAQAPAPAPAPVQPLAPAAQQMPAPAPAPAPAPQPAPAAAASGPTPPGVPARGGLTAAQVRGMTAPPSDGPGLTPAPATGWPSPQNWPNAAGMGQVG
ncbi:aminotransferase [Streptomyces sp. F-3]|uniref:pyridoxal phosphate-dependent aminotransferase n=1 Tax=Streptomyces sp. F-3 TaxID=1840095 RepID=UPI0007C3BBA1|nr:histidinol-phosphate transaminase [Streptomyces sp. F-3]GAT80428.1 aminotransferase [Streptomyces sp. F-3]